VKRSASISEDGLFRWWLIREWDRDRDRLCVLLLNPSTADAERDDASVRRLIGFARRWGYGSFVLVNLSAWRSTDPTGLWRHPTGGQFNRTAVVSAARERDVFVGVGANAESVRVYAEELLTRVQEVARTMFCLGETKPPRGHYFGWPKHPLRLAYDTERQAWPIEAAPHSPTPIEEVEDA